MHRSPAIITTLLSQQARRSLSSLSSGYNVQMPDCNFKPKPYLGPSLEETLEKRRAFTNPALTMLFAEPMIMHQGYMQWIWDHTGKRYLDLAAGIVTVSLGHSHPKLVEALAEQNVKIWHAPSLFLSQPAVEYVAKLAATLPPNLKAIYLTNSGTEANDLAVNMTRLYTGKFDIISFQNAYHGGSPHLMGATAMSNWKHNVPSGFGMHQTIVPDVYRGPWGGAKCRDSPVQTTRPCNCSQGQCEASERYLEQLHNTLLFSTPKTGVAGFMAESIQGAGGAVQFPKDYLKRAFEMVRAKGGLCISDEVQTGFGRTGTHMWGFEGHGVVPDIVSMAKGIGNGFPMAAVVTSHEIAKPLSSAMHFNTFGGDPLACVVGSAVLDVIEEDNVIAHTHHVGTYLLEELAKIRDESRHVGDVRGKGLMVGMELVQDKESRRPLEADKMNGIWNDAREMGLILVKGGVYGNVFRIKPPMCISKDDVDFTISVLRRCIDKHTN